MPSLSAKVSARLYGSGRRVALPKYRRHEASGQAIVTLSGRDFYVGPHGTQESRLE